MFCVSTGMLWDLAMSGDSHTCVLNMVEASIIKTECSKERIVNNVFKYYSHYFKETRNQEFSGVVI